tara:strand:- start:558 stop:1133 length:576 start_codon:yes stop_codon:yes gene_type:complete
MRIIGGKYKGLKLNSPKNLEIRPTSDRLKESIFSIIESKKYSDSLDGKYFLDLFTGSGSIALEAFSRGANSIYLIDKNPTAINLTKTNIEKLKLSNSINNNVFLLKANVLKLNKITLPLFHFIYIDPPYKTNFFNQILDVLLKNKNLNTETLILIETNKVINFFHSNYKILSKKNFGESFLYILKLINYDL